MIYQVDADKSPIVFFPHWTTHYPCLPHVQQHWLYVWDFFFLQLTIDLVLVQERLTGVDHDSALQNHFKQKTTDYSHTERDVLPSTQELVALFYPLSLTSDLSLPIHLVNCPQLLWVFILNRPQSPKTPLGCVCLDCVIISQVPSNKTFVSY